MIGLCVTCKKSGVNTQIECDLIDSSGRLTTLRHCETHRGLSC